MIHILYRHTSNASGLSHERPSRFSYDRSLKNILFTIKDRTDVQFHMIYDGTYTGDTTGIFKVINFNGGSDKASFFYTWEYAKTLNINDNDLVYFLENDYLHVNDWVDKVKDLYSKYNVDGYVSLYDCPDKYTSDGYTDLVSRIYITDSLHWRTTPSTTGTFIVNKQTLDNDFDIHTTFYSDHDKFLWLSSNRGRIVLTPMPGLSTHCVAKYMTPMINWDLI